MLFVYLVIGISLILYLRFFIIRSMLSAENRRSTAIAAIKAAYFSPLLLQGLLLIWVAVVNFFTIMIGCVSTLKFWLLKGEEKPDYQFLNLVCYIGVGTLVLALNAFLGKLSIQRKFDPLAILCGVLYVIVSWMLVKLSFLNLPLYHPIAATLADPHFYSNVYVIVAGILLYAGLLLQLLFGPAAPEIRFLQAGVIISGLYLLLCLLPAVLIFLVYAGVKGM